MRLPFYITRQKEGDVLEQMLDKLKSTFLELNPTNTVVLMVSPDYSATVAMHMAHKLSKDGEMCDLMMVDVPFPDQDQDYFKLVFRRSLINAPKIYENYVLAEAGIIRGGNYTWITELMRDYIPTSSRIITTALFENIHSKFKSNIVGEYYDDKTQDLTFYYEEYNKHWD